MSAAGYGVAPRLDISVPLQTASMLEVRSEVTGTMRPMFALLQCGWLHLLPPATTRLPLLKGEVALEGSTIRMHGVSTTPRASSAGAKTFSLGGSKVREVG